MKYETPDIKKIELDNVDIIQTSSVEGGDIIVGGGENETPFNPASLDSKY